MQSHYSYDSKMVHFEDYIPEYESKSFNKLCLMDAVYKSILWAESLVRDRTKYLNKLYSNWRKSDKSIKKYMMDELSKFGIADSYNLKIAQNQINN